MKIKLKSALIFLFFAILGHLFLLSRFKFTAWPEMLLWPYLWIHSLLPYKDVAIVHTPILIAKLAVFYKLFGVGITQLKVFTWLTIIVSDLILFATSIKIFGKKTATFALLSFIVWQIFFDGNGLWFDLLLSPLALLIFYFVKSKKYFWAGIFFAICIFVKQTAFFFALPLAFELIKSQNFYKYIKEFAVGIVAFGIPVALGLLLFGILPSFYEWAIKFGMFVLPHTQGQIQIPDLKTLFVALLPFAIFALLILRKENRYLDILIWAIAGCLGAYPRFEFFHFQPGIPYLAIATGIVLSEVRKTSIVKTFLTLYFLGSVFLLFNYFIRNWEEGTRFYEQDVLDVVSYVKSNTRPGERIFVLNWWDNIYALTNTLPATDPWVPQLSWYQTQPGIQSKEVSDIEKNKPKLIIMQDYSDSGLSSYKPIYLYNYITANYSLKDKVDGIEILEPNR